MSSWVQVSLPNNLIFNSPTDYNLNIPDEFALCLHQENYLRDNCYVDVVVPMVKVIEYNEEYKLYTLHIEDFEGRVKVAKVPEKFFVRSIFHHSLYSDFYILKSKREEISKRLIEECQADRSEYKDMNEYIDTVMISKNPVMQQCNDSQEENIQCDGDKCICGTNNNDCCHIENDDNQKPNTPPKYFELVFGVIGKPSESKLIVSESFIKIDKKTLSEEDKKDIMEHYGIEDLKDL